MLAQRSIGALWRSIGSDEQGVHATGTFQLGLQSLQRYKQRHRRYLAGLQTEASELRLTGYRLQENAGASNVGLSEDDLYDIEITAS